jgi:hypothetical protein
MSLLAMIIHDGFAVQIKYSEGYYVDLRTGQISTKPQTKYTAADIAVVNVLDVIQNVSWTFRVSSLFLIMALWNHLAQKLFQRDFMSRLEFRIYGVYAIVSVLFYPVLQVVYYFSKNLLIGQVVPEFIYSLQMVVLLFLSQRESI